MTEDKIAELDKKLEELPAVRENLVVQYRIEKDEQLKANENRNYVRERARENTVLYNNLTTVDFIDKVLNQKENIYLDNFQNVVRRR